MRVLAMLAAVACVALGPARARATSLPPHPGMFVGTSSGPAPATPLPMLDSTMAVAIAGPIVEATITQTFRNDSDRAIEATYIFPLPPDAAVSAMEIQLGTRTIRAAIEKRADAQRRYEQAVSQGVGAAVLDQERPDVFTQTVSAIPPHGTVSVTLRFDTVARYRAGTWELALPLVVAPRFVPGTASGRPTTGVGRAPDTDRAPDASRVTPGGGPGAGGKTEITFVFANAVDTVASPSHALVAVANRTWKLVDPRTDHDAILRWHAPGGNGGWVEQDPDGGYAAIVVESGASLTRKPGTTIRATLLLDRAATTRGDGDAVMRPLVRALLETFETVDRIAIAGSDRVAATTATEAERALETAWQAPAAALDLTKTLVALRAESSGQAVVLVSDGLVADDAAAIAAAARLGVPVHVLGFGPAPNRALLGAIAAATGGTVRFASTADDLRGVAREVIADLANPPVPLTVAWGALAASDVVPANLPRLGVGQATLVLARVASAQRSNARVRGDLFAIETLPPTRPRDGATTPRGPIARRWSRDRLEELLARHDATATTAHALRYGLVSPYTTMVAIGTDVVVEGGVKHSVPVPVSVPAGMRWQEVQRQVHVDTITVGDTTKVVPRREPTTTEPKPPVVAVRDAEKKPEPRKGGAKADKHEAPAPQPTPTSPTTAPHKPADDRAGTGGATRGEDTAGGDGDEELAQRSPPRTQNAPEGGRTAMAESISITSLERERHVRAVFGAGYGAARYLASTQGFLVLDARVEVGVRLVAGLDASLWLVDGFHGQGRVLAAFAARGLARWFELGLGVGVHLTGDTYGPALSASLRVRPHILGLGAFLRYDGAILRNAPPGGDTSELRGQNAASVGVEYRF